MAIAIKAFIQGLDKKIFLRLCLFVLSVVIVVSGGLLFYYLRKLDILERKLRIVYRQREEAHTILSDHAQVKEQRVQVNEILAQDKKFKIVEYVSSIVGELQISSNMSKDPALSEHDLNNGYSETVLDIQFKNMNMKQVVEFLYKIEQNDRVYTKNLMISKVPSNNKVDVTVVIATLQQKLST